MRKSNLVLKHFGASNLVLTILNFTPKRQGVKFSKRCFENLSTFADAKVQVKHYFTIARWGFGFKFNDLSQSATTKV